MKNQIYRLNKTHAFNVLFVFISIFFGFACKKTSSTNSTNNTANSATTTAIQTLTPLSYLPAFPGSYWNYTVKNSTIIVTYTTAPTYVLDSVNTVSFMPPVYDKKMVPIYNGLKLWTSKTYTYYQAQNSSLIWIPLNKDSLSVKHEYWETGKSINQERHCRMTLTRDTTLTVKGRTYYPVIVTRDYIDVNDNGNKIILFCDTYYAKNVGMIDYRAYNTYFIRSMNPKDFIPRDSAHYELEIDNFYIHP